VLSKRLLAIMLLGLLLGLPAARARAQNAADSLARLNVEIWPDFDQPEVLVLLTGTLPADVTRPATVTLPVPEGARINAVARIDAQDRLVADLEYNTDTSGTVTLTTPDAEFRVEYYTPYETEGDQRTLAFEWQAAVSVAAMAISVQQPAAATAMTVSPAPQSVATGTYGLDYHALPIQDVPAGQNVSLTASYTMAEPQLSVDLVDTVAPAAPSASAAAGSASTAAGDDFNWPLALAVAGAALLAGAGGWLIASRQPGRRRVGRPRPVRPAATRRAAPSRSDPVPTAGAARFCHNCGAALEPGDRFCRECGTPVKP
jgi:hypothetical protein